MPISPSLSLEIRILGKLTDSIEFSWKHDIKNVLLIQLHCLKLYNKVNTGGGMVYVHSRTCFAGHY